jgi:hypothetical protein
MNVIRTLWASIQGSPVFMRRVNGWLTVFWIAMIPVSVITGWIHSVAYISALSLWALVSGHWSAWQAARVEVAQERQQQEMEENPPEERIVEAIVRETTVEKLEDAKAEARRRQSKTTANGKRRNV